MMRVSLLVLACVLLMVSQSFAAKSATLSWDPVVGATSYTIYRGNVRCSDLAPLQPVPGATTTTPSFIDTTVPDAVIDVCYEVTASNSVGESPRSIRVGKTFAPIITGAVAFSRTAVTFSAVFGTSAAQLPLVTLTNNMNVSVSVTWTDTMANLSNSMPAGTAIIQPGATLPYTIKWTPGAVGTLNAVGFFTVTPAGGAPMTTNVTLTQTVTPLVTPPSPTNLKVTQLSGDAVIVAWEPKNCLGGVTNVRSGPTTNKVITITCLH